MNNMKTLTKTLMSEKKLKVIKTLLEYPEREWTINEISKTAKTSYPTTWRLIKVLDRVGVLKSRKKANLRLIKLNRSSPYLPYLRSLFKLELRPLFDLAKEFAKRVKKEVGVRSVILFGSVVKGTASIDSDIDILVLTFRYKEKEDKILKIASEMEAKAGKTISPIVMDVNEFRRDYKKGDQFARSVFKNYEILEGKSPWTE